MRRKAGSLILLPLLLSGCNGNENGKFDPPPKIERATVTIGEGTHPLEIVSLPRARNIISYSPDGKARFLSFSHPRYQYWKPTEGWMVLFPGKENRIEELHAFSTNGINSRREYNRVILFPEDPSIKIQSPLRFEGVPDPYQQGGLERLSIGDETVFFERAETPDERRDGLMWRTRMSENDGMLFVYSEPDWRRFWMGNCLLNLDIAFFRADRSLINVVEMDRYPDPSEDPGDRAASEEPAKYVLEMNQGWFQKRKLIDAEGLPVRPLRFRILE